MTEDKTTRKFVLGAPSTPILALAFDCRHPLLVSGATGLGKSQWIQEWARAQGLQVLVLNLALFESSAELMGLPKIDGDVTRYALPAMLPRHGRGIVLIEEAARSAAHVMAPLYEFLTSRRIGDYELPPGWVIFACMNPPGPDYDGHPFDKAMRDRFLHIEVIADAAEWLRWAEANGAHRAVLEAVRADVRVFQLASPRTWHRSACLLRQALHNGMPLPVVERVLAAELQSVEAAHAVMRHVHGVDEPQSIAPADVLANYARDSRLPRSLRALLEQGRTDTVEKLVHGVEQMLGGEALAGAVASGAFHLESLERFAQDVPGDRGADLLRAYAKNPASGATLAVEPEHALLGYRRSPMFRQVAEWLQAGLRHRLAALMHRIADHLERLHLAGRTEVLRRAHPVRINLAHLGEHVGEESAILRPTLERLGFSTTATEETP